MKVVIVGDGKVGGTIASQLATEGHDIIVIDNNTTVLTNAVNTMDIISVEGNGASLEVQRRAGVESADILIAATSADEVNMLACLLGKKLGARHTIARVRSPEYISQIAFLKDELGLSMSAGNRIPRRRRRNRKGLRHRRIRYHAGSVPPADCMGSGEQAYSRWLPLYQRCRDGIRQ